MCGIVAYIGDKKAIELLLKGLARLEYRGYDSAGLALVIENDVKLIKAAGKVVNLKNKTSAADVGTCGIAHTRWATHGKPNDINAHPHSSLKREVSVVHNGIIENSVALKTDLISKGYVFVSETDTEVLCHLVLDMKIELECNWPKAVASAMMLCEGTFGACFVFRDSPDMLIAVRRGSPLLLGVGENEYFLASDASAFIEYTNNVVYLNEDDIVVASRKGYSIKPISSFDDSDTMTMGEMRKTAPCTHQVTELRMKLTEIEKGGYDHFMLKEIKNQPESLANCLRGRITKNQDEKSPFKYQINMAALHEKNRTGQKSFSQVFIDARKVTMIACGTSWHSCLLGEYIFEQYARISVEVEYASEFRYRNPIIGDNDIVIGVSQSGETADTAEALRMSSSRGAATFGIVNSVGSTIARETDAGVYIHCGPEIGVASTKAFTGQVLVLMMMALELSRTKGLMGAPEFNTKCEAILGLPEVIKNFLPKLDEPIQKMSRELRLAQNFLFLGRGPNFPIALEGSLKLKEISYIHAEGYPAAEMKHGPIALIDRFMPVVIIAPKDDAYPKVMSNIQEVVARNGCVIAITDEGNTDLDHVDHVIHCPVVDPLVQPIVAVIPLQLLSYQIAKLRGCEIDMPRNLAKAVTVE